MAETDLSDDELFRAAVSYSLRNGKLKAERDANPEQSRSTDKTYVLAAADGRVIDRLLLDLVRGEATGTTPRRSSLKVERLVPAILIPVALLFMIYSIKTAPPAADTHKTAPPSDWLTDGSALADCKSALRSRLRDPDSYQETGELAGGPIKGDKAVWTWKFRSRNGFGGMNLAIASCVAVSSDRSVAADVIVQ